MREIKFRGKRIDNNEWLEGYYVFIPKGRFSPEHMIQTIREDGRLGLLFHVDEKTVSQFTGLKDKNDREIYEGDIVKYYCMIEDKELLAKVEFREGSFMIGVYCLRNKIVEIKGNIYENPELLEVG